MINSNNIVPTFERISNVGAFKALVDDVKSVTIEAVKKNTNVTQLKADLVSDGLTEEKADLFVEVGEWGWTLVKDNWSCLVNLIVFTLKNQIDRSLLG